MIDDYASSRGEAQPPPPGRPQTVAELAEDPERFCALRETLRRYCFAFLRSEEDAEDAVQVTLERALRYGTVHTDGGRWLIAIARNVCRGMVVARRGLQSLSDHHEAVMQAADVEAEVALRQLLRVALDTLSPMERRAVGASWVLDQTSYDAARAVGIAHQTLRVHLSRARKKLALYLEDVERASAGFLPWLWTLPHRALRRQSSLGDRLIAFSAPALAIAVTIASVAVVAGHGRARPGAGAAGSQSAPLVLPHTRDLAAAGGPAGAAFNPATTSGLVLSLQHALSPGRPGDAYVDDVQPSPDYATDRTVYASATDSACQGNAACGELFVSRDAGHTWTNVRTLGLQPHAQLLLPPSSYASGVFYAFGAAGLQITRSWGQGFATLVADLPGYAGVMPPGSSTNISVANVDLWNFATAPVPGLEGAYLPGITAAGAAVPLRTAGGWTLLQPVQTTAGNDEVLACGGGTCQVAGELPWSGNEVQLTTSWTGAGVLALGSDGVAISHDGAATFSAVALPRGATALGGVLTGMGRVVLLLQSSAVYSDDAGATWHQLNVGGQARVVRQTGPESLLAELVGGGNPARLAGYACSADAGMTWRAC